MQEEIDLLNNRESEASQIILDRLSYLRKRFTGIVWCGNFHRTEFSSRFHRSLSIEGVDGAYKIIRETITNSLLIRFSSCFNYISH